jgi:hypothetical protein
MSADVEVSLNTKLEYVSTPPSTYSEIAEVYDANGPEHMRKVIGLSALRDLIARKKVGRADSGSVTLTLGYTKTVYALVLGFFKAGAAKTFRFTMPEGSTDVFSAFVTKVGRRVPDDDKITFQVTLEIDGDNTFTAA